MEAFFISLGLVALAELGDKTQLLAILLAARFHRPWTIIAGILTATVANHLIAATVGDLVGDVLKGALAHWVLGIAFIAFAGWTLIPDKLGDDEAPPKSAHGVFWTTVICFFMAEMGDKTQVATLALAARFHTILPVAAGTTIGMMLADGPAVFISRAAAGRIPVKAIRIVAAVAMVALGVWTILSA
jgi:putative Ca2+/H+ antiporter (TMEM165/GDT1 family)